MASLHFTFHFIRIVEGAFPLDLEKIDEYYFNSSTSTHTYVYAHSKIAYTPKFGTIKKRGFFLAYKHVWSEGDNIVHIYHQKPFSILISTLKRHARTNTQYLTFVLQFFSPNLKNLKNFLLFFFVAFFSTDLCLMFSLPTMIFIYSISHHLHRTREICVYAHMCGAVGLINSTIFCNFLNLLSLFNNISA